MRMVFLKSLVFAHLLLCVVFLTTSRDTMCDELSKISSDDGEIESLDNRCFTAAAHARRTPVRPKRARNVRTYP